MSKVGPRYFVAMAEHSRCQPGRPGPHGVGQDGSPGLAPFQSAKSSGSRLGRSSSTFSVAIIASGRCPDSSPYDGSERTSK